ncbi:MAG: hypothetical protein ABI882_10310 [Acidobacteriota bacterium]
MSLLILPVILLITLLAQAPATKVVAIPASRMEQDRKIAACFSPIFNQGLGDQPRADYITNFDFDGDWKGDNNWKNLDDQSLPLRAWVYFSVIETSTHYFVHYAVFHPRDYKSDLVTAAVVDALIRTGLGKLGKDPTGGLADEIALSHENDLEGCLVVAAKNGSQLSKARVQFVETIAHNRFLRYRPAGRGVQDYEAVSMKGQHAVLFVEPRGHGVSHYRERADEVPDSVNGVYMYVYAGRADDPQKTTVGADQKKVEIGYDLVPIANTLWMRAQGGSGETYGVATEYPTVWPISKPVPGALDESAESPKVVLGSAFLGAVGSPNRARAPWAWFDWTERDRPAGEWFFDPATLIARHFRLGAQFSRTYVYHPFLNGH